MAGCHMVDRRPNGRARPSCGTGGPAASPSNEESLADGSSLGGLRRSFATRPKTNTAAEDPAAASRLIAGVQVGATLKGSPYFGT